MNTTLMILGCCNVVIFLDSVKKHGYKRNYVAYLNLILGLFLIIASVTFLNHGE